MPIAVLAISVFKKLGKSTILENNIVQTIGSAGESVAGGVVFTMPALLFLSNGADYFNYFHIFAPRLRGRHPRRPDDGAAPPRAHRQGARHPAVPRRDGLRRRPHRGRERRQPREDGLRGRRHRALYKFLYGDRAVSGTRRPSWFRTGKDGKIPDATLSCDVTPEYLGVGYIIGPKIAGELVSGGVLSWLVLIPLISIFVPETRLVADLKMLGFSDAWMAVKHACRVDLSRVHPIHRRRGGGVRRAS